MNQPIAVSPQHPPSFAFSPFHSLQHTHPDSQITPTIYPPLFDSHLLIPSSLEVTCKPWLIFKLWFQAGLASGPRFYILSNTLPNLFYTKMNFNGLMLSAVDKCAENTLWLAQTIFIHIASKSY